MDSGTGTLLIAAGMLLILAGVAWKFGLLGWFGHLPGDIVIKGENYAFYFPLTTMIVLSVLLTVVLNLVRRF